VFQTDFCRFGDFGITSRMMANGAASGGVERLTIWQQELIDRFGRILALAAAADRGKIERSSALIAVGADPRADFAISLAGSR
jgi:hypothetical protein